MRLFSLFILIGIALMACFATARSQMSQTGAGVIAGGGAPPPGCASPTAPNGVVDLSQCSNAFYIAVIL